MSALSQKARAIIGAGREGLQPGAGDRERLEALLDARLAAGAPAPTTGGTISAAVKAWHIGVAAALIGGSSALALRWQADDTPAVVSAAQVPQTAVTPSTTTAPLPPSTQVADPIEMTPNAPTEPVVAASRSPKDQLALEVALLSRATSALRAGRSAEALKVLDEHKRQFPTGFLAVDRRAARAQALCSLKRVTEGRAELARLEPESPAAERTRRVCDGIAAKRDRP